MRRPTTTLIRPRGAALVLLLTSLLGGTAACDQDEPAVADGSPAAEASSARTESPDDDDAADHASPDSDTIVADGGDLPNGVYRVEFTERHLESHGLDADGVANNRGVWTTTLEDGHWTVEQVAPDLTDRFAGVYQVVDDDLYWRFHDTLEVLHLRWSTDAQGDLHFTQVSDTGPFADFQFALPWVRTD